MTVSAVSASEPSKTWVYFIQVGDDGPIKIGVAKDPDVRLATLQQASAEKLHGLTAVWAEPGFERRLHKAFARARIRGEWFHPDPVLEILIDFFTRFDTDSFWFRQEMPPQIVEGVYG